MFQGIPHGPEARVTIEMLVLKPLLTGATQLHGGPERSGTPRSAGPHRRASYFTPAAASQSDSSSFSSHFRSLPIASGSTSSGSARFGSHAFSHSKVT
jgi:hypothetical protein